MYDFIDVTFLCDIIVCVSMQIKKHILSLVSVNKISRPPHTTTHDTHDRQKRESRERAAAKI